MDTIKDKAVYDIFNEYFSHIDDPREKNKTDRLLEEILFITVLAVIAGTDDFNEIARYCKMKYKWLSTFLKLPGGIPSHDTFNRVLCIIDAEQFQQSFINWTCDIRIGLNKDDNRADEPEKDVISVDGKTVRRSKDQSQGKKAIHMVSAFSSEFGLVLGQKKCFEKSNEITATVQHQATGKETTEYRYYISSLTGNADFINRAVRKHWYIENKLHWCWTLFLKKITAG